MQEGVRVTAKDEAMAAVLTRLSAAEFEALARQPANQGRRLEFIQGEIIEVVSSWEPAELAGLFLGFILLFVRANRLGKVTGADGGYAVGDERVIPDVGFVRGERLPASLKGIVWFPGAPDLAVEVLSPSDRPQEMRLKLTNYLAAGTTVWVVDPELATVEVHTPGQAAQLVRAGETLTGGAVLPGFVLPLREIFDVPTNQP